MDLDALNMSGGTQANVKRQNVDLETAYANKNKLLQEVYDLSVNNASQAMKEKEELSPQAQRSRRSDYDAKYQANQANISKSLMNMRDDNFEVFQATLAAYGSDPTPENYEKTRKVMMKLAPIAGASLPKKQSKEALATIHAINRAALDSKQFRQEWAKQGMQGEQAEQLAKSNAQRDTTHMKAEYEARLHNMSEEYRLKGRLGLVDTNHYFGLANRAAEEGDWRGANDFVKKGIEYERLAQMAKASKGGRDAYQISKDQLAIKKGIMTDVQTGVVDDWSTFDDVSYNRAKKKFNISGLGDVTDTLYKDLGHYAGGIENFPAAMRSNWIRERVVAWPDQKRFIALPLDAMGDPYPDADGRVWTSANLRQMIGQKRPDGDTGSWGSTVDTMDDMDDVMEWYAKMLKDVHEVDLNTSGQPKLPTS